MSRPSPLPVHTQRSRPGNVCSASCDSGCTLDPHKPPRSLLAEQRPHWPEVHMTPVNIKRHNAQWAKVTTEAAAGAAVSQQDVPGCLLDVSCWTWSYRKMQTHSITSNVILHSCYYFYYHYYYYYEHYFIIIIISNFTTIKFQTIMPNREMCFVQSTYHYHTVLVVTKFSYYIKIDTL